MAQTGIDTTSALDLYMTDVTRYPLLDAEQERRLARQYERGRKAQSRLAALPNDAWSSKKAASLGASERKGLETAVEQGERARQRLIRCNLRLVVSMAYKYSGMGLPLIDLVQEGNIGLMEAVDRYDPERGFRFATYAGWWIKQAIRRALTNKGRLVRFPSHVNEELYRLRSAFRELEAKKSRRPTPRELAEHLGMSRAKVHQLLKLQKRRMLSLQTPVGEDGESELGDFLADDAPPLEEIYAQRHLRESVRAIVAAHLSEREQDVLRMRFGLDGREGRTLKQIADTLHLSRERVRQIESRALRRLRYARARGKLETIWTQV